MKVLCNHCQADFDLEAGVFPTRFIIRRFREADREILPDGLEVYLVWTVGGVFKAHWDRQAKTFRTFGDGTHLTGIIYYALVPTIMSIIHADDQVRRRIAQERGF
jgi:hypothetical protein